METMGDSQSRERIYLIQLHAVETASIMWLDVKYNRVCTWGDYGPYHTLNGLQLSKIKKSISDMSLT